MDKKTKEQLAAKANELFEEGYDRLFATDDGYFFTDPESVKAHAKSIDSEIFTFSTDPAIVDQNLDQEEITPEEERPFDQAQEPAKEPEVEPTADLVQKPKKTGK